MPGPAGRACRGSLPGRSGPHTWRRRPSPRRYAAASALPPWRAARAVRPSTASQCQPNTRTCACVGLSHNYLKWENDQRARYKLADAINAAAELTHLTAGLRGAAKRAAFDAQLAAAEDDLRRLGGAPALAPHLGKLTALQKLVLSSNTIGDKGASALAPHLGKLTALQDLFLGNNSIGDAGASALAPHLGELTALQQLWLDNNTIGDAGASALAPHLGELTALQVLGLCLLYTSPSPRDS